LLRLWKVIVQSKADLSLEKKKVLGLNYRIQLLRRL
jgi:hypothetical protein